MLDIKENCLTNKGMKADELEWFTHVDICCLVTSYSQSMFTGTYVIGLYSSVASKSELTYWRESLVILSYFI